MMVAVAVIGVGLAYRQSRERWAIFQIRADYDSARLTTHVAYAASTYYATMIACAFPAPALQDTALQGASRRVLIGILASGSVQRLSPASVFVARGLHRAGACVLAAERRRLPVKPDVL